MTLITHADVTRRRGWSCIVVGLGIGSVARQAARLSFSGWRGRGVPTQCHVPPSQILGAAGDWRGRRLHTGGSGTRKFDPPTGPLKRNSPANACGGQGLRRRLRRAFLGTFSRFPGFSSPENPSFGDQLLPLLIQEPSAIIAREEEIWTAFFVLITNAVADERGPPRRLAAKTLILYVH